VDEVRSLFNWNPLPGGAGGRVGPVPGQAAPVPAAAGRKRRAKG
jgi:hypothetical protein